MTRLFYLMCLCLCLNVCMCATGIQGLVGVRRGCGGCESLSFYELGIEPGSSAQAVSTLAEPLL